MPLFHVEALVVVDRGAPEVRNAAVLDNGIVTEHVACKRAVLFVEANLEIFALDFETVGFVHLVSRQGADIDFSRPELAQIDAELFVGNAIAGLSPEFIVLEAEIEIQEVLGTNCGFDFRHVNRDFFLFVRANVHLRTVQLALLDDLAVFLDRPVAIKEISQVLVEVAAFDLNLALGGVNVLDADLSVLILDFPNFGLQGAIGEYEAVRAEVVVVLPVAPHAAEFEVRRAFVAQALVNEVPNESAETARVAIEGIHVFLQVAHGVTHGMFVFAKHNRLVGVVVAAHGIGAKVHPAVHIGVVPVAFVMHKAGRVNLVSTFAFRGEHVTVTGFVTQ